MVVGSRERPARKLITLTPSVSRILCNVASSTSYNPLGLHGLLLGKLLLLVDESNERTGNALEAEVTALGRLTDEVRCSGATGSWALLGAVVSAPPCVDMCVCVCVSC
jgi:hypothetical protein